MEVNGIDAGMKILGVGDTSYSQDTLKRAITAAKGTAVPIRLTLQFEDRVWTTAITYHDGLHYPHLERVAGTPATLDDKPR